MQRKDRCEQDEAARLANGTPRHPKARSCSKVEKNSEPLERAPHARRRRGGVRHTPPVEHPTPPRGMTLEEMPPRGMTLEALVGASDAAQSTSAQPPYAPPAGVPPAGVLMGMPPMGVPPMGVPPMVVPRQIGGMLPPPPPGYAPPPPRAAQPPAAVPKSPGEPREQDRLLPVANI